MPGDGEEQTDEEDDYAENRHEGRHARASAAAVAEQEVLLDPPQGFDPWLALAAIGYPLEDRAAAVRAFHNHYRGMGGDELDPQDLRILYALVLQLNDY